LYAPLQKALGSYGQVTIIRYKDERTFEDYVESVRALLPENNAVLVAESFSGPVALALANRYPARISCLVLSATFAVTPFRELTRIAAYVPTQFFRPNPLQAQIVKTYCLPPDPEAELYALVMQVTRSLNPSVFKSRLAVLSRVDVRELLPKITMPVLYLKALEDKVVPEELSNMLVAGLPNVEVHEIRTTHMLFQTCPDESAQMIRQFSSRCSATGQ
jgi:pimeloyl-ACP methyl ester carboxylesterase